MSKRNDILWAAVDLMRTHGFEKTSVSMIVKQANVAQGTFYLYFQSKAELVLGIAQFIMDDLLSSLQLLNWNTRTPLLTFINDWVDLTFDHTHKHQDLIGFCYSGTAYYHSIAQWDALYIPYYAWLSEKIRHYQSVHSIRSLYPPETMANFLVGLCEHGAEQMYIFHHQHTDEHTSKDVLKAFITHALTP